MPCLYGVVGLVLVVTAVAAHINKTAKLTEKEDQARPGFGPTARAPPLAPPTPAPPPRSLGRSAARRPVPT